MTDGHGAEVWVNKDGRAWRIGGETEVAWIRENTEISFAITSAIPPVFEAYATLELPGSGDHVSASPLEDPDRHDAGLLGVLSDIPRRSPHPDLQHRVREVDPSLEDSTPPGHTAI